MVYLTPIAYQFFKTLGQPGNLTLDFIRRAPPLFFINRNQLWQYNNETAIYPVNVMNRTDIPHSPLQLVTGKKRQGVTSGMWRWRGAMLYYDQGRKDQGQKDQGQRGLTGLYYNCPLDNGSAGVFMYLQPYVAFNMCGIFPFKRCDAS